MRVAKKEMPTEEAAKQVEAVLFSSGRWMSVQEISRLCRIKEKIVVEALHFLTKKYENLETALELTCKNENEWKLTVRQKYSETVRKIVPQTELNKSVIETLAVIAWKAPVLQSEVIKIRTNKAYDDIKKLEEEGFISKEKNGRTYLIKLTKKFYSYFEINNREGLDKIIQSIKDKQEKKNKVEVVDEKEKTSENKQQSIKEFENKNENTNLLQIKTNKEDEKNGTEQ